MNKKEREYRQSSMGARERECVFDSDCPTTRDQNDIRSSGHKERDSKGEGNGSERHSIILGIRKPRTDFKKSGDGGSNGDIIDP